MDYGIGATLVLWYAIKLFFLCLHLRKIFESIKELLDKSDSPEVIKSKILKEVDVDNNTNRKYTKGADEEGTVTNTGRDDGEFFQKDVTNDSVSKKRIRRDPTTDSSPDSIDPRLTRKRASRKKKTLVKSEN